jgi:hypothetical protein
MWYASPTNNYQISSLLKGKPDCNFTYAKECPQIAIRNLSTGIDTLTSPMLLRIESPYKKIIVDFLIKNGTNINAISPSGETFAMVLLRKHISSKSTISNVLKSQKVSINHQDKNGNTLLHRAVQIPNLENRRRIVKQLLKKGANPKLPNSKQITPLIAAKRAKLKKIIRLCRQYNPCLKK